MLCEGFLNLLKPPGMTSHDVVGWARVLLGIERIGHLGTLDPAVAGVLPLALGRATRLADYASGQDKAYRAEIVFGLQTDSLDAEGAVVATSDASHLTRTALGDLLPQLTGEIEQVPPAFSAVSVGGQRLYRSARAGKQVAVAPRRVAITQLDLVAFAPGRRATALFDIVCSSGTYIRVLADELGRAAGCGACLGFLVRTRAGRFKLSEASTLEELSDHLACGATGDLVLPPDWPLGSLPGVSLDGMQARAFVRGTRVVTAIPSAARVKVYCPDQTFLGLGEVAGDGALQPRLVLRSEQELAT